jgi:hypothetical protein
MRDPRAPKDARQILATHGAASALARDVAAVPPMMRSPVRSPLDVG